MKRTIAGLIIGAMLITAVPATAQEEPEPPPPVEQVVTAEVFLSWIVAILPCLPLRQPRWTNHRSYHRPLAYERCIITALEAA